jgi:AhpD family alkylhydroperoxidase
MFDSTLAETPRAQSRGRAHRETDMEFHGVDVTTQFKRMRELVPEVYRSFLEFDQKAFKDGAIPGKTKELMALAIAQITQCPWCIQAHTRKAAVAGASDAEIAETTFVAMAMAAGAAWSHGGLALQCLQEHKPTPLG